MTTRRGRRLRLVAYLRVSTQGQATDGYGLDAQRAELTAWAKRHDHRIVQWCSDEGVSGTTDALDRDGLSCAIEAIESDTADGLIVARLDRLARALTVQEAVLAHVWKRAGRVFAADHGEVVPDDPDDPMRTAMRQMMGVFAELDRALTIKKLRDGRAAKAALGGYAGGAPGFGTVAVDGHLVPNETEAAAVERMAEMREAGTSYAAIAETLNAEGVQTKRGGRWHPSTVQRVLDPVAQAKNRSYGRRRRQEATSG